MTETSPIRALVFWSHLITVSTRSSATAEGRAVLVTSCCYISLAMRVRKISNSKVTFKIIQGHWQWCHSIGHTGFPTSLPLQLCLYLAPLTRFISYFPKFKEVTWLWKHPFLGDILCMHKYSSVSISTRNLKCLASSIQIYDWSNIFRTGHVTQTTPIRGYEWKCEDFKCVWKPTESRLCLTHYVNKSSRWAKGSLSS